MAEIYSDKSTRSAILSAAVAQFSYFQAAEPTDMATEELWYSPDDYIIRRFVDGEWIERGTFIPVNQQRCIVIKQAIINEVTITGPVYVIRDGNNFTTAPLYGSGVYIPITVRTVEGGTETLDAAFLDKYNPTVIGMGDAKRFLAADSEHDPYWEEFPALLPDTDSEFVNMTRRAGVWVPVSSCVRTETLNVDTMPVGQRAAAVLDGTLPEELMADADCYWVERYDFNYNASGLQRHLQTLTAAKDDEGRLQMFKRMYKSDSLSAQGAWDAWTLFYDSEQPPSQDYVSDTNSDLTHMTRIHGSWTPIASCQVVANIELDDMPAGQELAGMSVSDTAPADLDPDAGHFWVQRYDLNYEGSGAQRHIQTLNAYNLSANHIQTYKRLYTQEGSLQEGVWHEWIKLYDSNEHLAHAVWSTAATPRATVGQTITVTIGTKIGTIGGDTAVVGDELVLFDTSGVWGIGVLNSITDNVYNALVLSTTCKPEDLFGTLPTTDGDYIPHLTVSGGVASYSWEVNL
jgi:hypothetical protein